MAGRLPDAEWQHRDGLKKVLATLNDFDGGPRYVGGAVRDTLLGLPVSDVDIATTLLPLDVIDRLEAGGIKAIPTGIDHGTVTAAIDGNNYEITTLRRDVATDGRRATVAFSTDWQEDAARRDFTINALYADPESGEIFDYFNGLADLAAQKLRFIGDANQRIAEDFLRILRYFRFLARYGRGELDAEAVVACAKGAHGLTALSRERIAQELTRILGLIDPVASVELMISNGIFSPFLPELSDSAANDLRRLVTREAQCGQPISLPARYLTLLTCDAAAVDKVAARLKLSNRMREGFARRLAAPAPKPHNVRKIAYRADIETARDVTMLYACDSDVQQCLLRLEQWKSPTLSIKGGALIAMGLPAGPLVAKTLRAIETVWISEDFPDAERQHDIAVQNVKAALSAIRKV
ncbi:CCA tRNA nucleotidyltransferase [Sphingorhabdus sp.]|uniref:CCA tRNA nucleotidyltransferase n=1 Tax=Sphingorhabdus sp. TaxID=1902408 RepID=UPI00391B88CC